MSAQPFAAVPDKPALEGLEDKWIARWEEDKTFRFDRTRPREEVFSIDTPPPTVSGSLHVGHVFSYTHTDIIARFHRMCGKSVFYPMGWDDNGLPTERRVQNYFGVRCDPSLPYDPSFQAPVDPAKASGSSRADSTDRSAQAKAPGSGRGNHPLSVSRPNFIELCNRLTVEDEKVFEHLWRYLGLSVDWSMTYATIAPNAQRISQLMFLRLLQRGQAYQLEAPTLWDIDFRTAVAQAELEDREQPGAYYRLRFATAGFSSRDNSRAYVEIETTRPELLPACVALVAHPDDERYESLVGSEVITPLFGVRVPVKPHPLADPEKGSGLAMICTFGDLTDVIWWRELKLPVRAIIQANGTLAPVAWSERGWESIDHARAQRAYDRMAGLSAKKAQPVVAELLRESGDLVGEPRPIVHNVKFYEKGDRPLEIVSSRQWFIATIRYRDELLARGRELECHPDFMRARYENWVNGLNGDWCISRQRFFGVPFPVWYPLTQEGVVDYARPMVPPEWRLPIDPSTDTPDGFAVEQRGQPGGFVGDPDVMDTWATSSVTPQLVCGWESDPDLYARTFGAHGMDLRPQAHDIIRTWLFSTIVRSHLEVGSLPWRHAAISGWVLDPDRKKMSKSKGNVVTPMALLEEYGSDGVRYWAARGGPGVDTAFDVGQMKIGRRLAIKLLNASKFVLTRSDEAGAVTHPVDRGMLDELATLVDEATTALEAYEYTRVLDRTESFFWGFCDNYLELVKSRRYGDQGADAAASANTAMRAALSSLLRLLAPYLAFVTEEVWSWWQPGSIHRAAWPSSREIRSVSEHDPTSARVLAVATQLLGEVRKAKSEAKRPLKAAIARATIRDTAERLAAVEQAQGDLRAAGNIEAVTFEVAATPSLEVEFAEGELVAETRA
ncbi:MAG: valine--tRNA ligase [Vicinamibacterales bacterium]